MPSASYSYIDVATLDAVRERFANGDAVAILSTDLDQVIWANGPGAELTGHADIDAAIGAAPQFGLAAKRQIAATSGFPDIGSDRAIMVRLAGGMTSRAAALLASGITLPDGEKAILLVAPVAQAGSRSRKELAQRAISGFVEPGQFTALVDGDGAIEAASAGFAELGIGGDALAALVSDGRHESDRIVRRIIKNGAKRLPAGLARLTDSPERYLLVVIDEAGLEEAPVPAAVVPMTTDEAPAPSDMEPAGRVDADMAAPPVEEIVTPQPLPAGDAEVQHDNWYFSHDDAQPADGDADDVAEESEAASELPEDGGTESAADDDVAEPTDENGDAITSPAPPIDRGAAPVRFVWRTDADGNFSAMSPEFAGAVGPQAADVVGRSFADVAGALALDPHGEFAGLLDRRDTWSGRSVLWPVAGTDLKVPIDLAALPVYARDRSFQGFRGFGVARTGDAVVDPDALGLKLSGLFDASQQENETSTEVTEAAGGSDTAAVEIAAEKPADPFQGEVPALTIVPKPERRFTDKVIRLAEHRPGQPERSLSPVERTAFQEIGDRLRQDSEPVADNDSTAPEPAAIEDAPLAQIEEAAPENEELPAADETVAVDGVHADERDTTDDAYLAALDGVDADTVETEGDAEADIESPVEAVDTTTDDGTAEVEVVPARHGSLLDYAAWDAQDDEADDLAETVAAPVDALAATNVEDDAAPEETIAETLGPTDGEALEDDDAAVLEDEVGESASLAENGIDGEPAPADSDEDGESGTARAPNDTSILDKLPVPVLIHAGDRLHHANAEFLALTGYGDLGQIAAAGGLDALFSTADTTEDGEPDRQMRLIARDGREIPVDAHLRSVPWGGGKALMLVVQPSAAEAPEKPLLPNQPAVADLQARVAEMRTIIDTATDGVVLIANDGAIRSISRPAEALFGFDSDEVAGKPFASLFAMESQRAARDYLNGLSEHGVASVLNDGREVIGREAEGRFIPLFMTIGRLPGDSGFCAVVRDITQWKRAEEDLTQARAVAERASSQKSEFLARVSHEIRTPLNAIIGFSELMIDEKFGPVANDRYRDYLRDINRSGNHVLDLVNDLLDISKIEAGQQEMSYEAVSLNDTLAETVAMMQPQANRERVIIRSSFASKLPDVVADLRSVRQIALNILSNAVRYTQAGGQVIVSTAYETAGDVVMRVRDTGIGMSPAEIEQALKPFKQINALKRARGDGTGLGLPLTKAMVEANRAKFTILSTPGEGTLIEITFPSTRVLAD